MMDERETEKMLVTRIAVNAAKIKKQLEVKVGEYFIPTENTVIRCDKYLMLVRRNETYKLVGWMIDTESESFINGFLFADKAKERFSDIPGELLCTAHRGEVSVSDDMDYIMRGRATATIGALASIEGKEVGDTLYIPTC